MFTILEIYIITYTQNTRAKIGKVTSSNIDVSSKKKKKKKKKEKTKPVTLGL